MINALLLMATVTLVAAGHLIKVKRWGQLVSVYETADRGSLLLALAIGHSLNAVLPVRLGDAVRVIYSGKRMKNGYPLAISTVFADLYVDLVSVGCMFTLLSGIGKGGEQLRFIAHRYEIAVPLLIAATVLLVVFRKGFKKIIFAAASLFNEKIEYGILYVAYMCIASLKDLMHKVNKKAFVLFTCGMWLCYIGAYMIFAELIQNLGFDYSTSQVFTILFSQFNLYSIEKGLLPLWSSFVLLPLGICAIISIFGMPVKTEKQYYKMPLPQMTAADRLAFLKIYYAEEKREHIQTYLEINSDVTVLEDSSAGSEASTLLVMKDGHLMFRKYAFDEAGKKLADQIDWIDSHRASARLTEIENRYISEKVTVYDMPCYQDGVNLFEYVHMADTDSSWRVLLSVLGSLEGGIHKENRRPADREDIREYVEKKVFANLETIKKAMKSFEANEFVFINGKQMKTLSQYGQLFEELEEVFSEDERSEIHGDLTIENIICRGRDDWYLIDPNTGNILSSPFLDYAKLLQSLHGNYEFLRTVREISLRENSISFMLAGSRAYAELYEKYREYLREKFSREQLKSIYCHELVHWLRLVPYQIKKDEKRAAVYYAVLLEVLNELETCCF